MFAPASASALFTTATGEIGTYILVVLGIILSAWGGFLVLRYALRKARGVVR